MDHLADLLSWLRHDPPAVRARMLSAVLGIQEALQRRLASSQEPGAAAAQPAAARQEQAEGAGDGASLEVEPEAYGAEE